MRISRKKRPQTPLIKRYNLNDQIQAPEVRLIDVEGKYLGVLPLKEALQKANELELDLVEINPLATPPVAQIIDFSNFKYQREKEARKQKAKAHVSELKGIRLSMRISDHDLDTRRMQSEKFLTRGDKVKIEIILRGREMGKTPLAYEVIRKFFSLLEKSFPLRYDQEPTRQGNKITAIVAKK